MEPCINRLLTSYYPAYNIVLPYKLVVSYKYLYLSTMCQRSVNDLSTICCKPHIGGGPPVLRTCSLRSHSSLASLCQSFTIVHSLYSLRSNIFFAALIRIPRFARHICLRHLQVAPSCTPLLRRFRPFRLNSPAC